MIPAWETGGKALTETEKAVKKAGILGVASSILDLMSLRFPWNKQRLETQVKGDVFGSIYNYDGLNTLLQTLFIQELLRLSFFLFSFLSLVVPLGGKHYVARTKIDINLGAVTLFWIKWTDCPNGMNQENPLSLSSAFK